MSRRSQPGPSLHRVASVGTAWTSSAAGAVALVGLASQILLAVWLSAYEFGLYAIALSVSFILGSIANAGIETMLSQRKAEEATELQGPAFRSGLAVAGASALVLMAFSPVAARIFGDPNLVPLLVVTAIGFPIRAYTNVVTPILRVQYRFRALAFAGTAGAVSQYATSLALAYVGLGAMSLVLGTLVGVAALAACYTAVAGARPWHLLRSQRITSQRDEFRMIGAIARWPFLGGLAEVATLRVDYLVLGLIAPTEIVGGYFFAYQLVIKGATLLNAVSVGVLFPVLSQISGDHTRQLRGLGTATRGLIVSASVGSALLIATISGVERMIWGGKWAFATVAVAILASALPPLVAITAPEQLLKSRGGFRLWTAVLVARSVVLIVSLLAVGLMVAGSLSTTGITLTVSAALLISVVAESHLLSRRLGYSFVRFWRTIVLIWVPMVLFGWGGWLIVNTGSGNMSVLVAMAFVVAAAAATALIHYRWRSPLIQPDPPTG